MILLASALRVVACFLCVYKFICVSMCVSLRLFGCREVCV